MENNNQEALTAVRKALKLKERNNLDKTQKLFRHAITLSPNDHDVLLHYGEFLESCNNFIDADHFYLKGTLLRPENSEALVNRERTLPVVNQMDLNNLSRVGLKRSEYESLDNEGLSFKHIKRILHIWHIHHTVAIEGNTMSLAETSTVLESRTVISGRSILEFNEILGLESAFMYVNQTLARKNDPITIADILETHRRLMGKVDPTIAGSFRKSQVFVDKYTPPPASDVDDLMAEFIIFLQSPDLKKMHPIHAAAYAHHKFVFIHPFLDGNGRTARLLMNLLFIKYGYPPVIIRKDLKSIYFKALQMAHEGDIRPFYRFIALATEYTIDAFLHAYKLNMIYDTDKFNMIYDTGEFNKIIPFGS